MKQKLIAMVAIIAAIIILCISWEAFLILFFAALAFALIHYGDEKFTATIKEGCVNLFNLGKEAVKKTCPQTVEKELTIHDVEITELPDGRFAISLFTEDGKLTLEPRKFKIIPKVLEKGRKVTYKEVNTLHEYNLQKVITISAIDDDGEERIFNVAQTD